MRHDAGGIRERLTMARHVRGWDPVRAWRFIRASKAYRNAWERRRPEPGLPERAPFPVRMRTDADAGAMRWGMLAWEDPDDPDGPLAPFWATAGVVAGEVSHDAPPLARLAAEGGASLSGLRLGDGALMLRIESDGRSVQVRLDGGGGFPEDGGLLLMREVTAIGDLWPGAPAPPGLRRRAAGTASCCWRWNARRRGSRGATSRCGSGAGSGSRRTGIPEAGWRGASGGATQGRARSSSTTGTSRPARREPEAASGDARARRLPS